MKRLILIYFSKIFSFLICLLLFSSMTVAQVDIKEEVILTQGYEIILDETIID